MSLFSALPLGPALLCSCGFPGFPISVHILPVPMVWFQPTDHSASMPVVLRQQLRSGARVFTWEWPVLIKILGATFLPCSYSFAASGICCCPQPQVAKPRASAPNQSPGYYPACLAFLFLDSPLGSILILCDTLAFFHLSPSCTFPPFLIPPPNLGLPFSLLSPPWTHSRPYLYVLSKIAQPFVSVTSSQCSKGS